MPHISVTIPVYNRAHLVGRTIESILNQQFQDFDVIVVDDASEDNTVDVVKRYCERDPRVKLEVNSRNLGLTRNWNRCLELASGPLVQIMQSDDLIDSDYLQKASDIFDLYPSIGFVAATCRYIDAEDRIIGTNPAVEPRLYQAGDEAVTALLTGGYPHVSSIVMSRSCYDAVGRFDEAIWHGPDMEMDVRLAAHSGFYHFGDVHTSFRRHGSNMGNLEYLRGDFLEVDTLKKRKTWGYLSPDGLSKLGINNLEEHIARDAALSALYGAIITISYGRPRLTRYYLRQAIMHNRQMLRTRRWWLAVALSIIPPLGQRVMAHRLHIGDTDRKTADVVESSLNKIEQTHG